MRDRQSTPDTKSHHSQPTKERETQRTTAQQEDLVTQQNPLTQTISRMGSAPSAKVHADLLSRATSDYPARGRQLMLQMQRQYGNRYVQRVMELSRQGAGETEATPEVEAAIEQARGGGRSLDSGIQRQMESAFGTNFSGVRVHTDSTADTLNQSLSARAFTTGQDIFFRQGEYNPGSSSGKELLAHELTHVVQQREGIQPHLTISQPGNQYEQEAEQVAKSVTQMLDSGASGGELFSRQDQISQVRRKIEDQYLQEPQEIPPPRISVKSLTWEPATSVEKSEPPDVATLEPDKSIYQESEIQDQNASLTTFTAHANGVTIVVEAVGVYTSMDYPDGFKWTQTINTNVPMGGTTSPYVDPRPNDDTKPFYYTDAEHATSPTTFRDRPSRPVPTTGTTNWNAILGLNGVNESSKDVNGFDYLTYGFSIDNLGIVTVQNPQSIGGAGHRSILASEFPDWNFT